MKNRLLPALAAILLSVCAPVLADGYKTVEGAFDYGFAQEVLKIVNIERVGRGLEPLVMTPALTDAAMKRAAELAVSYSHTRPNGSECFTAIPWVGCAGENIAWGQDSPDWVMFDWMESPGHRANILDSNYKSIGVGCFIPDESYGENIYWVQAFSGGSGASNDKRTGTRNVVVDVGTAAGQDSIVRDYIIAFVANGGSGSAADLKVLYGESVRLPDSPFARKGFLFLGWATEKNGSILYKNGATVKNLRTDGGTVTLYAQWAKEKYKVKFFANGGKGKMAVQKFTYGKPKKLSKNKFKRKGYVFKGWAKSKKLAKKGKVAYKNRKKVKNLVTNGKTVKLYAVWKKK